MKHRVCECGVSIAHRHGRARYCETCAAARTTESRRASAKRHPETVRNGIKRQVAKRRSLMNKDWTCPCGASIAHRPGHAKYCEPCAKKRAAADVKRWEARNPESVRARSRRWLAKPGSAEKHRIATRRSQQNNPEKNRARSVKWRKEHPEDLPAMRAKTKEWRIAHPDRYKELQTKWMLANPEKVKSAYANSQSRRRAVKRAAKSCRVTTLEWLAILEAHNNRCAYCLRQTVRLAQDHVVPLSRGGWHGADNIVPACKSCNSRKSNKPVWAMLRKTG